MDDKITILEKILRSTMLMESAIKEQDINLLNEMLDERQLWMDAYKELQGSELSDKEQLIVKKFMSIDEQNNHSLKNLLEETQKNIDDLTKDKLEVKKKNQAAKRYVSYGHEANLSSKFNKKT